MSTPPRALFAGLVDDAAMFPPGNASSAEAIRGHVRYRSSWFADLVGPLLVPAQAFDSFAEAQRAAGSPELRVVLIGTTRLPSELPTGVTVAGFEIAVDDAPLPSVPAGMSLAAEIALGAAGGRVLAAVADERAAGGRVVAKFRTGGTSPEAFPSEDILAGVVCLANAVPVPLKLTAGLHHAVRFADPTTGSEQHGFLNVLAAVAAALDGALQPVVAEVLASRDVESLVAEAGQLTPERAAAIRSRFTSFGCCGVEDPIGDLVTLGLLDPEGTP